MWNNPNMFDQKSLEERSDVYAAQAHAFELKEMLNETITAYINAIHLNPNKDSTWVDFANAIKFAQFHIPNELIEKIITLGLSKKNINHQNFAVSGQSLIKLIPEFQDLFQAANQGNEKFFLDKFKEIEFWQVINKDLFLGILKNVIIADREFENLIHLIRKLLLLKIAPEWEIKPLNQVRSLLLAIAGQCFFNEYIYQESDEEAAKINRLMQSLHSDLSDHSQLDLMLIACYRPLYRVPDIEKIIKKDFSLGSDDEAFKELVSVQVAEPFKERELAKTIPCLKPITDDVSKLVRLQYEENPYPRWKTIDRKKPKSIVEVIQENFLDYENKKPFSTEPKILIAGCGTGQHAINSAYSFKNSQVLAIDLSLTALAYAKRKALELGVGNIQWMQADILDLRNLNDSFDIIESSGVLHHMRHPFGGWKVLVDMLNPGGLMVVSLYSEIARQDVVAARKFTQNNGYRATLSDIRKCRQHIFQLPDNHPIKPLTQTVDFYTTSACRDLIFHVQEHRFNLLELSQAIERLNLKLIGLEVKEPGVLKNYHQEFPDDPYGLSLENWHQFEQAHPQTFLGMYHLWLENRI